MVGSYRLELAFSNGMLLDAGNSVCLLYKSNLPNDVAAPVIGVGELLLAFPDALILVAEVDRRRVDLVIKQEAGDVVGAFALNGQLEDTCLLYTSRFV